MKTRAVRLYGERDLRLDEFELPEMKEDEMLVKIISDSVCMSTYKLVRQGGGHKRVTDNLAEYPAIIGHEMSGIVVEKGEKWVYSNSNKVVAQNGSFDKMLTGKIRGGNCASIANWAFRDMGITSSGEKFYGDSNGYIHNYNSGSKKLKSKLDKNCTIINGGICQRT